LVPLGSPLGTQAAALQAINWLWGKYDYKVGLSTNLASLSNMISARTFQIAVANNSDTVYRVIARVNATFNEKEEKINVPNLISFLILLAIPDRWATL